MARHEDRSLLEAALAGYHVQLQRISAAVADIQKRLSYAGAGGVPAPMLRGSSTPKGSRISPEGLERIRQGQLRRWAASNRAKAAAVKQFSPKKARAQKALTKMALASKQRAVKSPKPGLTGAAQPQVEMTTPTPPAPAPPAATGVEQ